MHDGAVRVHSPGVLWRSPRSLRLVVVAGVLALLGGVVQPFGTTPQVSAAAAETDGTPPQEVLRAPLPESRDADLDGWADLVEELLGSDLDDASSTVESIAAPPSCFDGVDNDLDGVADDKEPDCQPIEFFTTSFPPAGFDIFESSMTLDGYELATPVGVCAVDFSGSGPTVIERSAPASADGGARAFDTEMVAMQLTGLATLLPGSPCNLGTEPVSFEATMIEDPSRVSGGIVSSQDATGASDYPADSFFDVYFEVTTPIGLLRGGPPGGPAGDPVRVTNVVNSMPPYYTPANEELNPDCYNVDRADHVHCPKPPLDHFVCYTGDFPASTERTVTLSDQFGQSLSGVSGSDRFCNAVSKNGVAIFDEGAHLERFTFAKGKGDENVPRRVLVRNQLQVAPQELSVGQPVGLFVPSRKDAEAAPIALDHFKCYSVQGTAVGREVTLWDQFLVDGTTRPATVGEPRTLCNPTTKTHDGVVTPIADPQWHLVCYALKTEGMVGRSVRIRNQFVDETAILATPAELCVPSMKQILPDKKDPPPKRHPKLSGTAKYWKIGGYKGYARQFDVPFVFKSTQSCTYNKLDFRGFQKNKLILSGPGWAAYRDTDKNFDELTMLFPGSDSGSVTGVIVTGPGKLLPGNRQLAKLLPDLAAQLASSLESAADHKMPSGLVKTLGLKGTFGVYFGEYKFKNKKQAAEMADFFARLAEQDVDPSAG